MDDARSVSAVSELLGLVRAVAGRHGLPAGPVERPARLGGVNEVLVVGRGEQRYVLRVPRQPRPPEEFAVEAWCSARARELGVATPAVLHTGVLDGRPYSVQRWVEGADGETRRAPELWRTLGRYARTIAEVTLDDAPPALFSRFGRRLDEAWQSHVRYNIDLLGRGDPLVDLGVYPLRDQSRLRAVFLRLERQDFRHGLAHGDLALHNLLVPDGPSAPPVLLDWGSATTGPVPHLDVALLLRNRDERGNPTDAEIDHLLDGFGLRRPEFAAEVAEVRLLQALDLVRWALARAPARVAQTVVDARAVVRGSNPACSPPEVID